MPEPGAVWLEADGTRVELGDATCEHKEDENGETFTARASVDSAEMGPVEVSTKRVVGDGKREPFESDQLQLTLIGGSEFREKNGISLLQHDRDQGGHDWLAGEGAVPIIRTDGENFTAVGILEATPMSEEPLEGQFKLALSCG